MKAKLAILLLASAVGLALASGATAKRGHVSGTYTVIGFGKTSCLPVGSSGFILQCDTTGFVSQYFGDLAGFSTAEFTQRVDCRDGRSQGKGVEMFKGSVSGAGFGTLTWSDRFRARFDCTTFTTSHFEGIKLKPSSGTGDLAGLHGKIAFGKVTYDGTLGTRGS